MSLKNNDIGCHVGSHCCGAFGYADDIMLLSPSVSGLQNMLDCCSEFAYVCMYVCITFISDSAIQNNIVIQCWGP